MRDKTFWKERNMYSKKNPISNYQRLQPSSFNTLGLLFYYADKDDSILEIGCNVGRHLKVLRQRGYKKSEGVEINKNCKKYRLIDEIAFEDVDHFLKKNKKFDIVFTHGNVIQFLSLKTFNRIFEITNKYIILSNEDKIPFFKRYIACFDPKFKKINSYRIEGFNTLVYGTDKD